MCELVGLYFLNRLSEKYDKESTGLYRDDSLAVFSNISGQADRIKKDIKRIFVKLGLKIEIKTNMKIVDFLDVTFNLTNGMYYPFKKPNNTPTYINTKSNHPPTIIKNLPASIGRRISDLSQNEEIFSKAKPYYQEALKSSGYNEKILYTNERKSTSRKRSGKRKIIWFNPPYSKNVQTNVAKILFRLVNKHFSKKHKFHKIFNRNTVKVSIQLHGKYGQYYHKA